MHATFDKRLNYFHLKFQIASLTAYFNFERLTYHLFATSEILITITFIAANFRLLALYSYTFSVHKLKHYLAHMSAMVCDKDLNFARSYSLEIPITYSEPKKKTYLRN